MTIAEEPFFQYNPYHSLRVLCMLSSNAPSGRILLFSKLLFPSNFYVIASDHYCSCEKPVGTFRCLLLRLESILLLLTDLSKIMHCGWSPDNRALRRQLLFHYYYSGNLVQYLMYFISIQSIMTEKKNEHSRVSRELVQSDHKKRYTN